MKFILVYNAKSDKLNTIIDFAHKVVNPSTYNCDLCKLTHSNFGERKEWSDFQKQINSEIEFYHSNEFEKKFNHSFNYPVVLDCDLNILLDNKSINHLKNVTELIEKMNELNA